MWRAIANVSRWARTGGLRLGRDRDCGASKGHRLQLYIVLAHLPVRGRSAAAAPPGAVALRPLVVPVRLYAWAQASECHSCSSATFQSRTSSWAAQEAAVVLCLPVGKHLRRWREHGGGRPD